MYTIYESPRRSPRHVLPKSDLDSNILKPKATSAIRKQGSRQLSKNPPTSAGALAAATRDGIPKRGRKKKVNDENKENSNVGHHPHRTSGVGVNGMVSAKNARSVQRKAEARDGRTPLKELPLNEFVDGLRKRDDVPSVEIVVYSPLNSTI
jgi:hypothetical protein